MAVSGFLDWHHETGDTRKHPERASPNGFWPTGCPFRRSNHIHCATPSTYTVADVEVEKSICMLHGENSTIVHYAIRPPRWPATSDAYALEVRALIACRDSHSTTHHNDALNPAMHIAPGLVTVAPYAGLPALYCAHDADAVDTTGHWYYNFEYAVERERG